MSEKRTTRKSGRPARAASRKPASARAESATAPANPMDLGLLEKLVRLMSANDLNTIEVSDGDRRVLLKRGYAEAPAAVAMPPAGYAHAPPPAPAASVGAAASAAAAAAAEEANLIPINSPMVGTFYAAPSPDAKPFVTVGTVVDEETDVCVIEAMKVFNNIKAECRGTISKILVTNGQTVEFGQTLFLVRPG